MAMKAFGYGTALAVGGGLVLFKVGVALAGPILHHSIQREKEKKEQKEKENSQNKKNPQ
jgi:hypothetical protein